MTKHLLGNSARARTEESVWTESEWRDLEARVRSRAMAMSDERLRAYLISVCRRVMRAYTTSFFIASRFLPRTKREKVEAIYAAVRYPDEVVDTFPLTPDEREARLDEWSRAYELALVSSGLRDSLARGVPVFLAPFTELVKEHGIPAAHYRSFLEAMKLDVRPRMFESVADLIQSYVYGSAIVVGYFLTYAYGASAPHRFDEALEAARELGIALQLTNFARDIAEDYLRGRCYLPRDVLRNEGLEEPNLEDPAGQEKTNRASQKLAIVAAESYDKAARKIHAFAEDCQLAIRTCIAVYRQLNDRILTRQSVWQRASVPFREKWRLLPPSKYWQIPLAYIRP